MIKTLVDRNNIVLLLTILFLFLTGSEFVNVYLSLAQRFTEEPDWYKSFSYFSSIGRFLGFVIAALLFANLKNYKLLALFATILFAGTSYLILFMLNGQQINADNKDGFIVSFFFTNSFLLIVLISWLLARLKALDNSYVFAVSTVIMAFSELAYMVYNPFIEMPVLFGQVLLIASLIIFILLATTRQQIVNNSDDNQQAFFPLVSLYILNLLFWILYFFIEASLYEPAAYIEELINFNPVKLYTYLGIACSLVILKYLHGKHSSEHQFSYVAIIRNCLLVMLVGLLVISYKSFAILPETAAAIVTSILLILKTTAVVTFGAVSIYLIVKNTRTKFMILAIMLWLVTPLLVSRFWWSFDSNLTTNAEFIVRIYFAVFTSIVAFSLRSSIKKLVINQGESSFQYSQQGYQWKETSASGLIHKLGYFNKLRQLFSFGSLIVRLALAGIFVLAMDLGRVIGLYTSQVACQSLNEASFVVMAELLAVYFIFIGLFSRFAAIVLITLCFLQLNWIDGLFVSDAEIEKNSGSLFMICLLASYIVIFGSGFFSLTKIVRDTIISYSKLTVIIVAGCLYCLIIFLQSDQEQVEIVHYKNSYTRVSLGASAASNRREQVVFATQNLLLEIYGSVLKPYLKNGYNMPTTSTDLIFLNDFIEKDYPQVDYRVVVNDIWQEPYILNPHKAEIRSSGPDKIMNTEDDIVFVDGKEQQDDHRIKSLRSWIADDYLDDYELDELQYYVWDEKDELYGEVKYLTSFDNVICTK